MEQAIKDGRVYLVRRLCAADPEALHRPLDKVGNTPMHVAAKEGHVFCMRALAETGAGWGALNRAGATPLRLAVQAKMVGATTTLMSLGVDPETCAVELAWTPLHQAAWAGDEAAVETLAPVAAHLAVGDRLGWMPLHVAALSGQEVVVRALVENMADVATVEGKGSTALHMVAYMGHEAVVRGLVENKADVEAVEEKGWTALHWAALNGHEAVVRALVVVGASVLSLTFCGATPAFIAAAWGRVPTLHAVLLSGGKVDTRNIIRQSLLHAATLHDHIGVLRFLRPSSEGGGESAQRPTSRTTAVEDAVAAAPGSLTGTIKCCFGHTPLHLAAGAGRLGAAEELLNTGRGESLDERNARGQTPPHLASEFGHYKMIQLLVDKGADVAAVDERDATPLHRAAVGRHHDAVQLLLDLQASVTVRSVDGLTPLHHALHSPSTEPPDMVPDAVSRRFQSEVMDVAKLLVKKGAPVGFPISVRRSRQSPLSETRRRLDSHMARELLGLRVCVVQERVFAGLRRACWGAPPHAESPRSGT